MKKGFFFVETTGLEINRDYVACDLCGVDLLDLRTGYLDKSYAKFYNTGKTLYLEAIYRERCRNRLKKFPTVDEPTLREQVKEFLNTRSPYVIGW